jgi:hypothetical protein
MLAWSLMQEGLVVKCSRPLEVDGLSAQRGFVMADFSPPTLPDILTMPSLSLFPRVKTALLQIPLDESSLPAETNLRFILPLNALMGAVGKGRVCSFFGFGGALRRVTSGGVVEGRLPVGIQMAHLSNDVEWFCQVCWLLSLRLRIADWDLEGHGWRQFGKESGFWLGCDLGGFNSVIGAPHQSATIIIVPTADPILSFLLIAIQTDSTN